jgi:hypothetical protein
MVFRGHLFMTVRRYSESFAAAMMSKVLARSECDHSAMPG